MIYLVLTLAFILRLILSNQSLWLDEAATLLTAKQPFTSLISVMGGEFHPPLLHFVMHFWLKFGITAEWFLRLPSILAGVGTIYFLYLILREVSVNKNIALVASFLLAINPLHIYYSQELRMYSFNAFFTTISWFLLLKLTDKKNIKNKTYDIGYFLFSLANLYSFYGAFFNIVTQLIFVLAKRRFFFEKFLFLTIGYLLLFIPWLPNFLIQLKGGRWLTSVLPEWKNLSGTLTLKSLFLIPAKFSLGRINFSTNKLYSLAALCITFYFASLIFLSWKENKLRVLWFWLLIPLSLASLVSASTPVLGYWRYIFLLPPFIGLITVGLYRLPQPFRLLNIFTVALTFMLANLLFWVTPAFQREDWKSALSYVQQNQNSVSIFAFSDAFAPVRWYAPDLTYSAPLKNLISEPGQLELDLSQATLNKETIYYFEYLSGLTDPHANISSWLRNAGFEVVSVKDFPGVGFVYEYKASF